MYDLINKFEKLIIEYNESQKILTIALFLTDIVDSDSPYEYTPFPIIDPLVEIYQQFMKENYEQLLMQLILTEDTVLIDYESTQITLESDYVIDFIEPPLGFTPKGFEEIANKFMYPKLVLHFRGKSEVPTYDEIPSGYEDIETFNAYGIPIHHGFPPPGEALISHGILLTYPTYIGGQWYNDYRLHKGYTQLIKAKPGDPWDYMQNDLFDAFILQSSDLSSEYYWSRGKGSLEATSLYIDAQLGYGRDLYQRAWRWIVLGGVTDNFYLEEVPPTPSGMYHVIGHCYSFTDDIVFVPMSTGAGAINAFIPALFLIGVAGLPDTYIMDFGLKPFREKEGDL